MEYPHQRYITYLMSRRMSPFEICADCQSKGLMPPLQKDLLEMTDRMGAVPTFWRATVTRQNVKFRRWLRDMNLTSLWVRDLTTEAAFNFLYRKSVRKDFEVIIIAHGDPAQARKELLVKYPEGLVPETKVLERFCEFFWNMGQMSPGGIFEYLEEIEGNDEIYLPALQGDLIKTYSRLGLQQRIKAEDFLQNVVELANQQVQMARANPAMSGAMKAGTGTLIKVGIEAHKALEDLHVVQEGSSIRKDATDFLARPVQATRILSIDDLQRDQIDAEAVGVDNVHRFPLPRD